MRSKDEILKLWVNELRSGNYKQGRGCMRSYDDRYDPFGVLCDLAMKDGGPYWEKGQSFFYTYMGQCFKPPKMMIDFLKLSPKFIDDITVLSNEGLFSFKEIASYIQSELKL